MTSILEQWKPVVGYEGLHEVSDQGRVFSLIRYKELSSKPNKCIGYVLYLLSRRGDKKMFYGHALVLEAFAGFRPSKDYQACHINGNRADNRLINLRWDTCKENYEDARRHGTNSRGSKHGQAKLTEQDVIAIRKDVRSQKEIAIDYGVNRTTISNIKSQRTWTWL